MACQLRVWFHGKFVTVWKRWQKAGAWNTSWWNQVVFDWWVILSIDFVVGVLRSNIAAWTMFLFSLLSCIGSVYLGYILFYILHDTCVVCISTYVVNACLLIINFITLKRALAAASSKKKKEWTENVHLPQQVPKGKKE